MRELIEYLNFYYLMDIDVVRTKVKEILQDKNLTISQLERLAGIGPTSLRYFLTGRTKKPKLEVLIAVAKVLQIDVSELMGDNFDISEISKHQSIWDENFLKEIIHYFGKLTREQEIKISSLEAFSLIQEFYFLKYNDRPADVKQSISTWLVKKAFSSTKKLTNI